MKKKVLIGVGLAVVLLLLIMQQTKRMGHGAEGVANSEEQAERAESLAAKNTKNHKKGESVASGGSSAPVTVDAVPPAKAYKVEELSDPVKALLGLDGKVHNYPELMQAIARLNNDLSAADVAALRELLTFSNDRFPAKMRPIEVNAVKNDVLDRLLRQTQLSEGLGLQMAEMAANPANDPVWRDYSIQFMGKYYGRFATESGNGGQRSEDGSQRNAEASAIHDAMFAALDERSATLAGTSLIGLELLSRTHDEFDRELIVGKAVEVAADESASPSCRLTAMRMASLTSKEQGAEGMASIADTTRLLAQTGETVLLRSAAIVTLGEVGSADDRELLDTFALSDNKQIAAAAQLALQKMDSRN